MEDLYLTLAEPEALTAVHLPPSSLRQKGTHLFIKSHKWDTLYIDITEDIPLGCLKYVSTCVKQVKADIKEDVCKHTIELLAELYPDLSGKIRKAYLFGGDVRELLP